MVKVQAWERLNDPNYSSTLNMVEFHNLMLEAGFPAQVAKEAANERGMQRLSANQEL